MHRQQEAERNYSTAFIGEEKVSQRVPYNVFKITSVYLGFTLIQAFGFGTPQLQKRVADALLAEAATAFSPLPGALEASLNFSPVEGLASDAKDSEEEEESEAEEQPTKVSW